MKPIGIVSALTAEARTLGPAARHGAGLSQLGDGALLAVSGIGESAAAAAARRLVLAGATALASFGMAGGLDPTLLCGVVLLPEEVAAAEGGDCAAAGSATSGEWRQRLRAALPASCIVCGGKLLSSARPIGRPDAKAAAWHRSRAAAVDMESAAIAQVAGQAGLPFIALRVIVDTASDELPAAVIAASSGGQLQVARLLAGLLRAPGEVGMLIRLSARYRVARRVLAAVARPGSPARRALVGGAEARMP
ncbi:MAG: purine and other phosphorylase-like protein, family 1 [Gammaproteobacteria bacterium]|nr:purine and other phosphorylase-like protein, family 1 [Gammaproteobacteria bacterium]MDE2262036.1 purine and other phosphorylase-like protein, family 1 [Gammaproteobacteria bacterium]